MQQAAFTPSELNKGFVVAITIVAKENEGEAVAAILEGLISPTMAEPGVKLFLPYRSPTNPLQFFLFELYRDEQAWADHQATDHFTAAIAELVPRAARRERVPYLPYTSL